MHRRGRALILALLALALAGLTAHALQYAFITDDAYISFRYSYNLAYHNELTFNLGDRVEGYTNFLWTVILGLLLKAQLRPEVMARVLGLVAGGAVLVLLVALTRIYRGRRPSGWDCLGALLLPAMAPFAAWCSGGLETQLFTALVTGGVTLYCVEQRQNARWRLSGLVFALAAMTRPEGLMLFGLTGLHRLGANLLGERRLVPRLAELGWLGGFLVPYGLFFLWRYHYYGYPFPNTYYIKAGGGAAASALKWGLPYLWDFVRENGLYVLPALLLLVLPLARRRRSAADPDGPAGLGPAFVWSYVALLVLPFTAYVVLVGGDFMAMGRFFVPVLPLCIFFAQEAVRVIVEWPGSARAAAPAWHAWRFAVVALLLGGLLSANSVQLHRDNRKLAYRRWGLDTIGYLDRFARDRILIGAWMRRHLPRDTYLAVGGAGAIVYASRMKALDTYGLNDRWIAHHTPAQGDRPGHTKSAPDDYLLRERPDLMCHQAKHQDWPYAPPPHEAQLWRARGYRWVCLDPPGLRPAYYCCLKRIARDLGPYLREVGT